MGPSMNCIVRECGELVEMNHVLLLIMSKRRLCLKLNNWMKIEMKSLHQNVAPIVLDKVQSFVYPWWPSVSSPDPVGTPCLFAPQWECYEISPIQQNDQPNVRPKCSFVRTRGTIMRLNVCLLNRDWVQEVHFVIWDKSILQYKTNTF